VKSKNKKKSTKQSESKAEPSSESAAAKPSVKIAALLTERRALFLIIAASALVYANSLSGSFVFDDTKQIVGNPDLRSWSNIIHAFSHDVWSFQRGTLTTDIPPPYYRPLFTAYLTINYQLFGLWEPGWHLMNLLVHTIASALVYFLLKRFSGDLAIALLGALLFAVHPAHVESVSWISGIPDPLAALFYIPCFIWYVRYREERNVKWLALSLVAYGLAALCKETPLVLPLVLAVWELTRAEARQNWTTRFKDIATRLIPYGVVGVAYLALRFSVLGRISWKHPFMARVPDSAIWMTLPYVFLNYLKHLIAPFHLSLIYGTSFITDPSDMRFLLPLAIVVGLSIVLWKYKKLLTREAWLAIAMIVAPLLPVLNLRVFHYEYIIQDRYLYLPSIGFCYLVSIAIMRLARHQPRLGWIVYAVVAVSFGISTALQNRVWQGAVPLWERAIYYSPNSWSTHYNLGLAHLGLKQFDQARAELIDAQRLNPQKAEVLNNLALAQAGLGNTDDAIVTLKAALAIDPRLFEAHNNLAAFLYDKKDFEGAKREIVQVLQYDPGSTSARFNLARIMAATGDHAAAIREFETVVTAQPDDSAAHYELALSYAALGRKADAAREIRNALTHSHDPEASRKMQDKLAEWERGQ
jgi:Flp pilus assembly protein TadD